MDFTLGVLVCKCIDFHAFNLGLGLSTCWFNISIQTLITNIYMKVINCINVKFYAITPFEDGDINLQMEDESK